MSPLRPPLHDHACVICRGKYPCWEAQCGMTNDIVCEDCVEDKEEVLLVLSDSGIACLQWVN